MRFAIGQISHETCTFCAAPTTVADFQAHNWCEGEEIIRGHRAVRSYLGGMIDGAVSRRIEIVPTFSAGAVPSGTITREALDEMCDALVRALRRAGSVDAICLALHGAGVAEGVDDIESHTLRAVRDAFGAKIPVVATLDLHANMTRTMLEHADALLGVNCYPHTDSFDRGVEAVAVAEKLVRREIRPVMHLATLPMLIPASPTTLSPAKDVNAMCWEWEAKPGVLDCTFFHGFPQTDIPSPTVSVLATADGDAALALRAADDVAARVWDIRAQFTPELTPPSEAIRQALAVAGQPVVINEPADNPGGGGPGDGTHLLHAMVAADLHDACFGFVTDPETVRAAHRAGVGETIPVQIGGKSGPLGGRPVAARAYVKALTDGRFIQQSPMGAGARVDLGPMARLEVGGIDVLVATKRQQTLDPELFLLHGIDVRRYKIVALKSEAHFRAAFEPIAAAIIAADAPGLATRDLATLPYRRLLRPVWPFDPETTRQ
jgi:microcystin degradation protein MlrC